jgi:hypothetical protein
VSAEQTTRAGVPHTADHETRRRFRAARFAGACSPARGSGCALEEGAGGCRNCGKVGGGGAMVCILARKQALIPNNAVCLGRTYKDWEAVRENHHGWRKNPCWHHWSEYAQRLGARCPHSDARRAHNCGSPVLIFYAGGLARRLETGSRLNGECSRIALG